MHIPVYLRAPVELGVDGWEEVGGKQRGDDGLDELVEEKGGDNLMDVVGEGPEGEGVGYIAYL